METQAYLACFYLKSPYIYRFFFWYSLYTPQGPQHFRYVSSPRLYNCSALLLCLLIQSLHFLFILSTCARPIVSNKYLVISYSEPCNSNPTTYKIKFSSLLYHTPGTPQPICDTKFSQELCSLHSLLNKICFCLKLHSCSSAQMKTLHLLKGTTPAIFLLSPASFVSFPLEHA